MLKPPFTVIILKKPNHPVTVRVTGLMLLILIVPLIVAGFTAGYAVSHLGTDSSDNAPMKIVPDRTGEFSLLESADGDTDSTGDSDIRSLSVRSRDGGSLEFAVEFVENQAPGLVYVWLIIQQYPDQDGPREVIPRNPLFRGIPVDYRNGLILYPKENDSLTIPLEDSIHTLSSSEFRVLVFADDGTILADRRFSKISV